MRTVAILAVTVTAVARRQGVARTASVVVVFAAALLLASSGGTGAVREGGIFRVAIAAGFVKTIDPALTEHPTEAQLLDPACATLMAYPDKPRPEGLLLKPDLAASDPVVSKDGRTYTFAIRRGLRFSTGASVTAAAFARALERIFTPQMKAPLAGGNLRNVIGVPAMLAGNATTLRGVIAKGRTLTLRLTKRVPDLLDEISFVCAVPANLPVDPEGAKAPLPSPAPYYVAEYVPGERLVLERNRFYSGRRPHHVDSIVADLGADAGAVVDDVASGDLDWGWSVSALRLRAGEMAKRYGVNKSQFFVAPGNNFLRMFVLNASRPLFRNNPKLRQAVNFAVDRRALTRELGPLTGTPTDKYLSPAQAGYRDDRIYPLQGPDLRRARALAKGHLRNGKAVLYTRDEPNDVAQAQVLQRNLKAIGLDVKIVTFPGMLIFDKLAKDRAGFDIGRLALGHSADPSWFTGAFDGRTIGTSGNGNWSYFNSPLYNRLFDKAARLTGEARARAYGDLDVMLSRDAAPAIPVANLNAIVLVSARVGCVVLASDLDLTAVCLK